MGKVMRRRLCGFGAALAVSAGTILATAAPAAAMADVECARTDGSGACTELREVNRYGEGRYEIVCVTSYYEARPSAWEIAWVDCW